MEQAQPKYFFQHKETQPKQATLKGELKHTTSLKKDKNN